MPNEMPSQTRAETSQPSGWILCGLYILLTAVLGAACALALDQLWTLLVSSIAAERDGLVIDVLSILLSMAAVTGTLAVVFFLFRRVFHLRPLRPADQRVNAFKTTALFLVAYFAFLLAYLFISQQVGIPKEELEPDVLGTLFAYVFYSKRPLWALLNPSSDSNEAPDRSR